MLAYRDGGRPVDPAAELSGLRSRAARSLSQDDALSLLIEIGMLEAAIVDAASAERDERGTLAEHARRATTAAADAWIAYKSGDPLRAARVQAALDTVARARLPSRVTIRIPEGFAYYALFPETYVAAAERLHEELRISRACVIGLRSIGTTLAAVVHAALARRGCVTSSWTVRPRGHPFAREVRVGEALQECWRREAARGAVFLVADEGPGLSGSSFASAAQALASLGIPDERVIFLPAWDAPADRLNNAAARDAWRRHRRISVDAASLAITPERLFGIDAATDYSAGRWRADLYADETRWPEIVPEHERWKVRARGEGRLLKFVGLGPFGSAAHRRAESLADLGLGAAPGQVRHGFIDLYFEEGRPAGPADSTAMAPDIGRYIARVGAAFPASERVDADALIHMILTNIGELRGEISPALEAALNLVRPVLASIPAARIDGRMLPHEWIRSRSGTFIKTDGLDHHCDHFFPGQQHPAWDLAAAAVEFDRAPDVVAAMLHAYERNGGDRAARTLLPFYRLAYASFRAGYATLAGLEAGRRRYSQCALNEAVCFSASSKSPRKQIARSSMKT